MKFVVGLLLFTTLSLAKDPFINKENAVGYIVLDKKGSVIKFIVLEDEEGKVKLIKTKYEPKKVLRHGGRKE